MYRFCLTILLLMTVVVCFAGAKGSIRGKVTDYPENALSNVTVELYQGSRTVTTQQDSTGNDVLLETTTGSKCLASTQTNKDGIYAFQHIKPGRYIVTFYEPDYERHSEQPVWVTAKQTTGLNVILYKENETKPLLATMGKLYGSVKDKSGNPLVYVNIMVKSGDNVSIAVNSGDKTITGTQSKANGTFTIINIPPGTYKICFSLVTFARLTTDYNVNIRSGESTNLDAVLQKKEGTSPDIIINEKKLPNPPIKERR